MRGYKIAKRAAALIMLCMVSLALAGCGDKLTSYEKALDLFGEGEYAEAAAAFGRLDDYLEAETYAAYAQGLTFYEQGNYAAAEPYFGQTRDFMYGEERYRVCHAYALEEAELFAEAAQWYGELGEFEDAPIRAAYCMARAAMINDDYETALANYQEANGYADAAERLDALSFELYERATALMKEKSYEQALDLFTKLGDNYDAQEQARICKNYFLDLSYNEAEILLAAGDFQGAYDTFSMLAGYRDAEARANAIVAEMEMEIEIEMTDEE